MKKTGITTFDSSDKVHWNYRIFKYDTGEVGIHEAYYRNGKLEAWTREAMIVGDSVEELLDVLEMIKKDIERFPKPVKYK